MSKFPLYPGDEAVAKLDLTGEDIIFQDLHEGQLVVVNKFETLRLDLSNQVTVEALTDIADLGEGCWKYQYIVENISRSENPVDIWYLEIPRPRSPNPNIIGDIVFPHGLSPTWETIHFTWGEGRWAVRWSRKGGGPAVPAGYSYTDFLLESDRKPGFVMAYFQNRDPEIIPPKLSNNTQERLHVLYDFNFNSYSVLTLGPKFRVDSSLRDIAADYYVGISRLMNRRRLDENSLFVKSCLEYLQEQIDNLDLDETGADTKFPGVTGNSPGRKYLSGSEDSSELKGRKVVKTWKRFIWICVFVGLITPLTVSSASAGVKRKIHVIQLPRVNADGSVPEDAKADDYMFPG